MTPKCQWSLRAFLFVCLGLCPCPLQAEETAEKPAPLVLPTRLPQAESFLWTSKERAEKAEVKAHLLESLRTDLTATPASQSSRVERIRWHLNYQNGWFSSKLQMQRKLTEQSGEVGTELFLHPTDNLAIGASATSRALPESNDTPRSVWERPSVKGTLRWTW